MHFKLLSQYKFVYKTNPPPQKKKTKSDNQCALKTKFEKFSEKAKTNFFVLVHPFHINQKNSRKCEYQIGQKFILGISG